MFSRCAVFVSVLVVVAASAAFSQTLNPPLGVQSPSPGGLTLVPGTVVVPGVSGAANTGTVPLPGMNGAPGLGTVFPTPPPSSGSGLYPPAYYPAIPSIGTVQSTLPMDPKTSDAPPLIAP